MNALTVKEAIEQLQKCPPDLQLIDEGLEDITGFLAREGFVQVRTSPLPQFEDDGEEE